MANLFFTAVIPKKKSAEPRHCSWDADQGAAEQRKAGTLSGAAKAASAGYKSVSAQVGRFPRSKT